MAKKTKRFKQLLAVTLAASLTFGMFNIGAAAADEEPVPEPVQLTDVQLPKGFESTLSVPYGTEIDDVESNRHDDIDICKGNVIEDAIGNLTHRALVVSDDQHLLFIPKFVPNPFVLCISNILLKKKLIVLQKSLVF